ncbi:hypothetical protein INR49_028995 [Caranx melampygus]|nr:hypothetical protein INR49_028995 [Caranx melampygus]
MKATGEEELSHVDLKAVLHIVQSLGVSLVRHKGYSQAFGPKPTSTGNLTLAVVLLQTVECKFGLVVHKYFHGLHRKWQQNFSLFTYILHEFAADWSDLLAQSSTEHHDLLLMRTKCFTFFRLRVLFRMRARMRPGVPTTMWGQFFFKTSSSFLMARPPKNTAAFTVGMYLEKRSYSLLIWKASSPTRPPTDQNRMGRPQLVYTSNRKFRLRSSALTRLVDFGDR